jgi:hypothetical protein
MRELMFSMMRFSGAITMFGMEQVQNAISAPTDTRAALVRLCNTLDSMSESLASKLDAPKRTALDSMSKSQLDIWDNTASVVKLDTANMDTAADLMKKASESLADMIGGSANGKAA